MYSFISRLHPFPDGIASSTGLKSISRALAARKKSSEAGEKTPAATTGTAAGEPEAAEEVWQAAEILVEASRGEGLSSSRTAGSLLASLSHLRGALRRHTVGGSSGNDGGGGGGGAKGAWEVMSAGPKGPVLARAATGAVVRVCRSEWPTAVHLEATRLAGEVHNSYYSINS